MYRYDLDKEDCVGTDFEQFEVIVGCPSAAVLVFFSD